MSKVSEIKSKRESNKDLHVSFRVNSDMLRFHEEIMRKISDDVGRSVPQSRIMRAMIAVLRDDDKFKKIYLEKIAAYLKKSYDNW